MEEKTIELRLTLTDLDWARVNQLLAEGVCACHDYEPRQELDEFRRLRDLIYNRLKKAGL